MDFAKKKIKLFFSGRSEEPNEEKQKEEQTGEDPVYWYRGPLAQTKEEEQKEEQTGHHPHCQEESPVLDYEIRPCRQCTEELAKREKQEQKREQTRDDPHCQESTEEEEGKKECKLKNCEKCQQTIVHIMIMVLCQEIDRMKKEKEEIEKKIEEIKKKLEEMDLDKNNV
jgi:hypothetical protein